MRGRAFVPCVPKLLRAVKRLLVFFMAYKCRVLTALLRLFLFMGGVKLYVLLSSCSTVGGCWCVGDATRAVNLSFTKQHSLNDEQPV